MRGFPVTKVLNLTVSSLPTSKEQIHLSNNSSKF